MVEVLGTSAESAKCVIPVYCFMPDHVHLLVQGVSPASRLKVAMDQFKRRSGELLAQRFPGNAWQRNYHDHIIRHSDDLSAHVAYILNKPVRAGLVEAWSEYPFSGSVGIELAEYLRDLESDQKFGR